MDSKVYLSPIEDSHIIEYMSRSDDPELMSTMGWRPFGPDEKERFLSTVEVLTLPYCSNGKTTMLSIMTIEGDRPIGYVTLKGINVANLSAELGIAIVDSKFRSEGYGTDALGLAVEYAFNDMKLLLIGLTVFPSNTRAIKTYTKVGFNNVAVLEKSWMMPSGEQMDMILMELKKDEWIAAQL